MVPQVSHPTAAGGRGAPRVRLPGGRRAFPRVRGSISRGQEGDASENLFEMTPAGGGLGRAVSLRTFPGG